MGGRHPEGHITDPRNTGVEETSRRRRKMGTSCKGGQIPKGAAAQYMEWNMAYVATYMSLFLDSLLVSLRHILIIKPTRCTNFSNLFLE
jgi:hypothetical protein